MEYQHPHPQMASAKASATASRLNSGSSTAKVVYQTLSLDSKWKSKSIS